MPTIRLCILFCVILLVIAAFASVVPRAWNQGGSLVCDKSVCDLGMIAPTQDDVVCNFALFNSSNSAISVSGIATQCGCMVVQNTPDEIYPGVTADISVKVKTQGISGVFSKQLIVRYIIDEESREMLLTVTGNVHATSTIYTLPELVNFGQLKLNSTSHEMIERSFIVGRHDHSPVLCRSMLMPSNDNFEIVSTDFASESDRIRATVVVRVSTETATLGFHQGHLILETEHVTCPNHRIPFAVEFVE